MNNPYTQTLCRVCLRSCGIRVHKTKTGIQIQGDPDHPVSKGFICFRGIHYNRIWASDKRLQKPLLRKGNHWQPLSYEDALSVLAEKMEQSRQKYGAESVAFLKGEALKHQEITAYMKHLCNAFGTPNFLSIGSICQRAVVMGHTLTYGGIPKFDHGRIKTAVLWGRNIAVSSVAVFKSFRQAVSNGMKLVVIDPSITKTAEIADIHLRITPGSDGRLALAFIKEGIETYHCRPDTIREVGWNDLKNYLAGLSIGDLLAGTGIVETEFFATAQMIFENLPGWNQTGLGLELQPHGVQTIRAVASLQSLMDPDNFPDATSFKFNALPGQDKYPAMPDPVGLKEAPLFFEFGQEGQAMFLDSAIRRNTPYPVKTMLIAGSNPALTFPAAAVQNKMFNQLDFMTVIDLFMTPTARQADLILPAADFLNSMEIHDYGRVGKPYLGLVRPIMQHSPGWPIWKWIFKLADCLGLRTFFPWDDNAGALTYRLDGSEISFSDLLSSPTSVISYTRKQTLQKDKEIVHYYSEDVERATGMGSLTISSMNLPFSIDEQYPFWLSTGDRVPFYQHSQFRNSKVYLGKEPEPLVSIHPQAADDLKIQNEDTVQVVTRYGQISLKVHITNEVRRDCLRIPHGWEQANANQLTGLEYFDPISGFPWCRALPAKIVP